MTSSRTTRPDPRLREPARRSPRPVDGRSTGARRDGARPPAARREPRRFSPGIVILAVALIGSLGYGLYAITVRDASQIPLLASGAAVLGVVFIALALYSLSATWRAGIEGRSARSLALGLVGGFAAIVGSGAFAGAIILFQLGGGRS
jgi:hypothetical protein